MQFLGAFSMNVKNQFKLVIIATIALILSTPSFAESPYPNDVTIEITPSFRHVDTFKVNGFSAGITDLPANFVRQSDEGTEFSDTGIGIFGRVAIPAIRNNDRIMFEIDYFRANDTSFTDTVTLEGSEFYDVFPIDGGPVLAALGDDTILTTVGVSHSSASFAVLYGFGLPDNILGNTNLQVETGLQYIKTKNRLAVDNFIDNDVAEFHFLDEKVTAKYFGPVAGVFGTVPLTDKLKFTGRARTGILLYRSTLNAEQFLNDEHRFASDKNSGKAYLGNLEAGIRYSVSKWASVDLLAHITYLSKSPEIMNPRLAPGGNSRSAFDPVSLRTGSSEDAGISFSVSFRH